MTISKAIRRLPLVLALDFDQTLTIHDTISSVAAVAKRIHPDNRDFRWFVDEYMKDYEAFEREWQPQLTSPAIPPDRALLDRYLEAMRAVELTSMRRVTSHSILAGVTKDDMFAAGRDVRFLPGAANAINSLIQAPNIDCSVCVVSVNWSESFIRGALSANGVDLAAHNARPVDIYCNNMVFDAETGLSTGQLPSHMVVAADKVAALDAVKRDIAGTHGRSPLIVYAGDSLTDLPALLDADIGLLVGNSSRPVAWCERLCVRFGEQRMETDGSSSRVLHRLDSWDKAVAIIQTRLSALGYVNN
ncbi:hypothetical protein EV175_003670 [Coemansia sp. RSA 1933]|nr:hypothetical protein EV175_003670 [Coemansia sp. RSA 1933]